jgi:hypothetical protein
MIDTATFQKLLSAVVEDYAGREFPPGIYVEKIFPCETRKGLVFVNVRNEDWRSNVAFFCDEFERFIETRLKEAVENIMEKVAETDPGGNANGDGRAAT